MDENMEMYRNKMKVSRDPMSHRIIEKRRRDRMNNCLADLSRLIPATYLKKGRGRIEKTEIIELAIKHLKHLQSILCSRKMEATLEDGGQKKMAGKEQFYQGYQECLLETTSYLVETENLHLRDQLCTRLLNHLKQHGENVYNKRHFVEPEMNFIRRANSPGSVCNSDGGFGDVNDSQNVTKKSPQSPRYVSSPTIEVDSYDCAQAYQTLPSPGTLPLSNANVAKVENYNRWRHSSDLLENTLLTAPSNLDLEGDVGNIGGMSTCSSNRSDEVYKYKTNIKERFNADQKMKSDSDEDTTNDDFELRDRRERRRRHVTGTGLGPKRKMAGDHVTAEPSDFDSKRLKVPSIPIFAFYPKGSFYVPMTIDSSLVMPQLNALSHFPSALHQVGISVSFPSELLGVNSVDAMRIK